MQHLKRYGLRLLAMAYLVLDVAFIAAAAGFGWSLGSALYSHEHSLIVVECAP